MDTEEKIPVFFRNQKIGEIFPNRTPKMFLTERTRRHKFHIFGDGFGETEKVLDLLQNEGVEIIVVDYEHSELYVSTVANFVNLGKDYIDTSKGFPDKQIILEGKYWKKKLVEEKQTKLEVDI